MYPIPTAGSRLDLADLGAVALGEEPGVAVELDLAVVGHRARGDGVAVAGREHADVEVAHPLGDGAEVVGGKGGGGGCHAVHVPSADRDAIAVATASLAYQRRDIARAVVRTSRG